VPELDFSVGAIVLIVGAIVLVAIARLGFDGTTSVRSYTTAERYYTGLFAYTVVLLLVYAFLSSLFDRMIFPPRNLPDDPRAPAVALVVIVLIVRLPLRSTRVRRILQRGIGVPAEAEGLAEQLLRADPNVEAGVAADVALMLRRRGYEPDEAWLPAAEPMRALWFKTAVLFFQIRRWAEDRDYRGFVRTAPAEFDILRQGFDQLSLKVVRVLDTVEHLGGLLPTVTPAAPASAPGSEGAGTIRGVVSEIIADLREDIALLLRNACLFVARGVLAQSLTDNGRRRRLAKLGFPLEPGTRPIGTVLVLAWVAYLVIYGVSSRRAPTVVMIATIQVASLATAILPKALRYGFACENLYGRTPWGFVIGAGLAAVAICAPIQFAFSWLIRGTPTEALAAMGRSYPWLLTAFMTAATTAFLIQDSRWSKLPSQAVRRAADGAVMAAATVAGVLGARWILELMGRGPSSPTWRSVALAIASGLLIGTTVPSQVRRRELTIRPSHLLTRQRMTPAPART
jgi:hypothetical protein